MTGCCRGTTIECHFPTGSRGRQEKGSVRTPAPRDSSRRTYLRRTLHVVIPPSHSLPPRDLHVGTPNLAQALSEVLTSQVRIRPLPPRSEIMPCAFRFPTTLLSKINSHPVRKWGRRSPQYTNISIAITVARIAERLYNGLCPPASIASITHTSALFPFPHNRL
jgi:hypothetical protein